MSNRAIRIGIDVGGTHTKAVAIDNNTNQIVGKGSVMTTHHHERGVAAGVVEAFQKCLAENDIRPDEVIFIAHSTTQATNALLEGDVARVGVIGLSGGGLEGFLAKRQTKIKDIDLGTGKFIEIDHTHLKIKEMSPENVKNTIQSLLERGDRVIVASKAFGVDNMREERMVAEEAERQGVPCTVASDITKLYGLTTRTRTAALNASILPKMLETANSTEQSVRSTGIKVPLMIMRGDGGVMEINEMKKRPILTMLSGPAASVIGALMYLRASNGIYFEVGGTSTNIGVIKNGRPAVDYSIIGGHRTYVNSLDVRVLGVAGGSMVRARKGEVIDVGPRSAHIAGMGYACFTDPALFDGATLYYVKPRENDPADYVAIKLNNGESVTITNTCAANVLGILGETDYARGNAGSSRKAMQLLADEVGMTVEETAKAILTKSCQKIVPVIEDLITKYKIEREQIVLVGAGGGAGTLLTFTAKMMNFKYQIPENAEVISSIGVALAMVREMVERTIPNPTASDIAQLKKEAKELAMNSGAVEDGIEVYVEIDDQAQKVTAIAMGSTEVKTTDLMKNCTEEEALQIAAESIGAEPGAMRMEACNGLVFVATAEKDGKTPVRVVDKKGFVKIQRANGIVRSTTMKDAVEMLRRMWDSASNFSSEMRINPDVYVIAGSRVLDYSGIPELIQVSGLIEAELCDRAPEDDIILVLARNEL
ncbi:N-methylhydantoinase A/oxoprolinase/acetone carboxylase beta subunit [Hydrogenispora ethanolica]|uniref:N-methylhydantoinase A/oxoprolinase/acetone carboxylase beta subunit n=1 Tax=Hydrogenispora ethanolica TaxID=1082276 RepID=A0A4R1S005_HYDET|nr:hydantoinase/oxoprolinase family protein [Hydrogenispora ethanolica]TCL72386.1 N-methylhydantoinase A/oxoprolinase/acetone carboxylase beta subunit [Hydrogenispora ethanolica]